MVDVLDFALTGISAMGLSTSRGDSLGPFSILSLCEQAGVRVVVVDIHNLTEHASSARGLSCCEFLLQVRMSAQCEPPCAPRSCGVS